MIPFVPASFTFFFLIFIVYKFVTEISWLSSSKTLSPYYSPKFSNSNTSTLMVSDDDSFYSIMKRFPWGEGEKAYNSMFDTDNKISLFIGALIHTLIPFIIKAPMVPVNTSCLPPPLQLPPNLNECRPLQQPRKVGVLFMIGLDFDALEIHLNELNVLVDKFFLIESVRAHSSFVKTKPLLWDIVKGQERFAPFLPKIVHFVVTEAHLSEIADKSSDIWSRERLEERLLWENFLQWNNLTKFFDNNDLLGFTHPDEVPDRNNVFYLKTCESFLSRGSIDFGLWFPYSGLDTIYASDFPIRHYKFTISGSTYYTLEEAMKIKCNATQTQDCLFAYPRRMNGKSPTHLLGGMHLSTYPYPPFRLAKFIMATSTDYHTIRLALDAGYLYKNSQPELVEAKLSEVRKVRMNRLMKLSVFRRLYPSDARLILKTPWFYECNRMRYPAFEKKHDSRLDGVMK